jgi:hypothetical protein
MSTLDAADVPGRTLGSLTSVSDEDLGDELTVVWEIEPGREILPEKRLPDVTADGWDDPRILGASSTSCGGARSPAPTTRRFRPRSGPASRSRSTSFNR